MWRFALQCLPCLAFAPFLYAAAARRFPHAIYCGHVLTSQQPPFSVLPDAFACAERDHVPPAPPLSSRLLSEYLGLKTMLAIVCKTYEGVKALEKHDNEGMIDTNAGLYGLGPPIGRLLNGRFLVLCLEKLSCNFD
uniref:Secreted protein n=1 Tax=Ananas comosus var. bracteatus TaxID=296719 RepID=A0A6V7Q3J3_ANACO|nr:unnamed protein product [Ananas comosus var. bracteatus]